MWAICKKEWVQYFSGITGYLIIGFYLLINGLVLFILPNYNILDFGYASLQVYFDFAPWLLLLLVPAITMHSFSDEYKLGTYELIRSLPIRPLHLVWGKFIGTYLIVLVAILPTILYAFALDALSAVGGLDWGGTIGSYIGLLFLAAAYTAIGIYTSSATRNNLVSLLFSILLCLLFFKVFDWVSGMGFFKNGYDFYITQLGFGYHYRAMSRGVISLQDAFYILEKIEILKKITDIYLNFIKNKLIVDINIKYYKNLEIDVFNILISLNNYYNNLEIKNFIKILKQNLNM